MRIIAGTHRGMNLKTFDFDGTRPTSDKVRESIFNKLQFKIANATCLDLFGGTGAITLEMLSRGAKRVVVCDNSDKSIALIKENCKKAKENPEIKKCDYKKCILELKNEKFDIIFLDPPFQSGFGEIAIDYIAKSDLLNDDGIIVYECEKGTNFSANIFKIFDQKIYGRIEVNYLEKRND